MVSKRLPFILRCYTPHTSDPCTDVNADNHSCSETSAETDTAPRKRTHGVRSTPEPQPVAGARWLPLTKGRFALVDEADFATVDSMFWQFVPPVHGRTSYAKTALYPIPGGKQLPVKLHRFLWARWGLPATPHIDHRDGNGLDCRRANLRAATASKNLINRPANKNCQSGFKGVSWFKLIGKWRATIVQDRQQFSLGYFDDKAEAARAYDAAALRMFGEFAWLNFPASTAVSQ